MGCKKYQYWMDECVTDCQNQSPVKSGGWGPLQRTLAMVCDPGAVAQQGAREPQIRACCCSDQWHRGGRCILDQLLPLGHMQCLQVSSRPGWVTGCKDALSSWEQRSTKGLRMAQFCSSLPKARHLCWDTGRRGTDFLLPACQEPSSGP